MSGEAFNINALDFGDDLPDLQDDFGLLDREGETGDNSDSKNMIDQDLNTVIDYLFELERLDSTTTSGMSQLDTLAIDNAMRVNDQMQNEVKKQIMEIDRKMEENMKLLARIRSAALAEYRAAKKVKIHSKYDNEINYFPAETTTQFRNAISRQQGGSDDEMLSESESYPENDDEEDEEEEHEEEDENREEGDESDGEYEDFFDDNTTEKTKPPNKAWSVAERRRLAQGIHAAAQRAFVLGLKEKSEEWKVWDLDKIPKENLERHRVDQINWQRVSSDYVKTRNWVECVIQWTTQEHPDINKKPWGKAESERLAQLVEEKGPGKWEEIANTLNTNRTVSQCFSHYMAYKNNLMTKGKFTKEEDDRLMSAVKLLGDWNWQQIATVMGNRTGQQCLHRWTKSLDPSIKRENWCKEEDKLLTNTVNLYGAGNWRKIQRFLPGRTDVQCRERWMNILSPALNRSKLTAEELQQVVSLVNEHGPKWSYIATFFPGRTDNMVMKEYKHHIKSTQPAGESKKRGRPRSRKRTNEEIDEEVDEEIETEAGKEGRKKRKKLPKGRPTKSSKKTTAGRPRKMDSEKAVGPAEEEEEEGSDAEIEIVEVVEPVKKRKTAPKRARGRPRKLL